MKICSALGHPVRPLVHQRSLRALQLCSHICDPPHSLHWLLMRLWGHMLDPRHSLHVLLMRSCSHICDPPHSRQKCFCRPCSHFFDGIALNRMCLFLCRLPSACVGYCRVLMRWIQARRWTSQCSGARCGGRRQEILLSHTPAATDGRTVFSCEVGGPESGRMRNGRRFLLFDHVTFLPRRS